MKVGKNGQIFQKNGPFITLGRNVTAKLDKKYVDKMSQTLGQNVTVGLKVSPWHSVQVFRMQCPIFGWMNNPSTEANCHSRRIVELLDGRRVWVELSRCRFIGGWIIKAPPFIYHILFVSPI